MWVGMPSAVVAIATPIKQIFFVAGGAALARNCHSELPGNSAPGSAANFLPLRGLFVLRFRSTALKAQGAANLRSVALYIAA